MEFSACDRCGLPHMPGDYASEESDMEAQFSACIRALGDALRLRAEQAERERDAALEAKAKHEKNANEALESDAATIATLTTERDEARAKVERLEKALTAAASESACSGTCDHKDCYLVRVARAALEDSK